MLPSRRIAVMGGDVFRDEYSLAFDGTDDYVDAGTGLGTYLGANYAGDLSVSVWFKADSTDGGIFQVGKHNYGEYSIRLESDELILALNNKGWEMKVAFTDTGSWNHVVGVLDGESESTTLLYLNGVSVGTEDDTFPAASAMDMNNGNVYLGKVYNSEFNGNISEIAVYDTALSISQVKTLYNGKEPYNHKEGVATGNLKAWYRMGDGALDRTALLAEGGLVTDMTENTYIDTTDLVTNGTFTGNATGWTLGTGWAYDSNNVTCSSNNNNLSQDVSAVADTVYRVEIDISAYTSGTLIADIGGSTSVSFPQATGSYVGYMLTANTNSLRFYGGAFRGTVDNIRVFKVFGNPGVTYNMTEDDFEGDTP